jgi:cytochrome P450
VSTRTRDLATTPTREMPVVSDPEDVEFVLRSRDFEFHRPEDRYSDGHALAEPLLRNSLLHLWGEDHFARRRLESPLFRHETLKKYEDELVVPRLRREIAALKEASTARGEIPRIDVITLAHRVFLILVAKLVGLDTGSQEQEERLLELVEQLERGLRVRYATNPEELVALGVEAVKAIEREFLVPSLERRERDLGAGVERNDLVTIMLKNSDHFRQWDEGVVVRETTLFVSASTGTATREMALAIDEIEAWVDEHPEDGVRRTDAAFLAAAFDESLRYMQSVREIGRVAARDVTLPSGVEVAAGELVKVMLIRANQERFGPAGEVFDPYREPVEGADPYGYAFGGGRHTCIGKWLVLGRGDRNGIAVSMLRELYRAGMRRDPENPPTLKKTHTRRFDTYPIIFQEA